MTATRLKYFQTGSFAAGNRLVDPEARSVQAAAGAPQRDHLRASRLPGMRRGTRRPLCARRRDAGDRRRHDRRQCNRLPGGVLDAVSGELLAAAVGPLAVRQCAGGRHRRSLRRCKAKGNTHTRVVGQGGDGGTVDIGFACLSGMFERGDDVLYICYDNEGYMNTGVQRSARDPAGGAHDHDAGRRRGARCTLGVRARARH